MSPDLIPCLPTQSQNFLLASDALYFKFSFFSVKLEHDYLPCRACDQQRLTHWTHLNLLYAKTWVVTVWVESANLKQSVHLLNVCPYNYWASSQI